MSPLIKRCIKMFSFYPMYLISMVFLKKDTGVDLVAAQKNGDLVAIQAKFYTHKVGKEALI